MRSHEKSGYHTPTLWNVRIFNPFVYNDEKWSDILLESCGVNSVRILKYVWPFFIIMHEMGNYNNRKQKTFD